MMSQFITPENVIPLLGLLFYFLFQSKYFATQVDVRDLRLEIADLKDELKDYSDRGDKEILHEIKKDIQEISQKIDRKHPQ